MPTLLLIRHGENDLITRCLYGRMPGVHLNQEGLNQAESLARLLAAAPLKAIYSSPLERTLETAGPLAAAHRLEIQIHPGLNEIHPGILEGKSWDELNQLDLWQQIRTRPSTTPFPNGESFPECQRRVVAALDEIAACHQTDDLAACFTHGDIIRLAVAHYLHMQLDDYRRLETTPASISCLMFRDGQAILGQFNQSSAPAWVNGKLKHPAA